MQKNFDAALKAVLIYEGGKVNDPLDPGGKTNQGVTQRVYTAYLLRRNSPPRDVYTMTATERDDIYRRQYWNAIRGDDLPSGVDLAVFDEAVNSGVKRATMDLQKVLGVLVDGSIGEVTLRALESRDPEQVVLEVCAARLAFLHRLGRLWQRFGKGWSRRVLSVRDKGVALARAEKRSIA